MVVDGRRKVAARRRVNRLPSLGRGGSRGADLGVDAVGHHGPGHGAEQGEAERAADLLPGVEQAGRQAGIAVLHLGQGDQGQRHEHRAQAGGGDHHRAEQAAHVGAVLVDLRQPEHAARADRRAGQQQRPGPDPRDQLGADPGHEHDHADHRQVSHAGLQRAVAPHRLHEQAQEEEHPEHRGTHAEHDQVGAGPAAVAEDPQRHQRFPAAGLDEHKRGQQHHGRGQRGHHLGVMPVSDAIGAGGRAGQAVHQRDEPERAGDRAGQVEPAGVALRLRKCARRHQGDGDPDRHVHEKDPTPGDVGGEQAAQDQADRRTADAHRGVDAHGPVAGRALRERGRDQRQRGRGDDGSADALQGACAQQPRLRGGEAAQQRGH